MVVLPGSDTISVVCEHRPDQQLTTARLGWGIEQPNNTYTIALGEAVSLTLDQQYPVRPSQVDWRAIDEIGGYEQITTLFGEAFALAMEHARNTGPAMLELVMSPEQRRSVATVQFRNASTPPLLRRACQQMLSSTVRQQENLYL